MTIEKDKVFSRFEWYFIIQIGMVFATTKMIIDNIKENKNDNWTI